METHWIHVIVHPRAGKDVLVSLGTGRFEAWVRAKPVQGQANEAVSRLIVRTLGIAQERLRLVKGAFGRHKVFKVLG